MKHIVVLLIDASEQNAAVIILHLEWENKKVEARSTFLSAAQRLMSEQSLTLATKAHHVAGTEKSERRKVQRLISVLPIH